MSRGSGCRFGRFNGAAASQRRRRIYVPANGKLADWALQWGRRFAAAETRRAGAGRGGWRRFNGAAASQRRRPEARGRSLAVVVGRFNGAAASQRRRQPHVPHPSPARRASMGPPLRSGGDCPGRRASRRSSPCFNGAAASQRRRPAASAPAAPRVLASMGPPLRSGGDHGVLEKGSAGRAASMGPPLRSGGDGNCRVRSSRGDSASMGPPLRSGGDEHAADGRRVRGPAASMGPPLRSGGDAPALSQQTLPLLLQWGRRFAAAETK